MLAPRIGFATVHRALNRLSELGTVMKIDVPNEASVVYEPSAPPHAHFRCTDCGAIQDVDFAVPAETLAQLAERHGIAIEQEAVTFAGRCARCG